MCNFGSCLFSFVCDCVWGGGIYKYIDKMPRGHQLDTKGPITKDIMPNPYSVLVYLNQK